MRGRGVRGNNKGSIEGVVRGSGEEEWGEGGGVV